MKAWPVLGAALLAGCEGLPNNHTFSPVAPAVMGALPVAAVPARPTGAIYPYGRDLRLFESRTARRVGDIITIRLAERTNASKKANTSVDKDGKNELDVPVLFGNTVSDLEMDLEQKRGFDGKGSSDQSNSITGTLSAVVIGVYPNGNLAIHGEKQLTLNQGEEVVQIQGVVRPDDIAADNSVASGQVADAQITYAGRGALADSNAMGWASRFFNSPYWPF